MGKANGSARTRGPMASTTCPPCQLSKETRWATARALAGASICR